MKRYSKNRPHGKRPELLLCPNIPKPMHGMAPRVVLGQEWWDKERVLAYQKAQYKCEACGVEAARAKKYPRLEGHELYDIDYQKGKMVYRETVALCHYCHNYIHDGRMRMLVASGEMAEDEYLEIQAHGDSILETARLSIVPLQLPHMCPWSKWRLVIEGKEYPPLYKSEQEWLEAWSR